MPMLAVLGLVYAWPKIVSVRAYLLFIFESNLSVYSLYYTEACNEFLRLIAASLRLDNTVSFEEMPQQWRVVGNTQRFDRPDI